MACPESVSPRPLQKRNAPKRFSDEWVVFLPSRAKRPKLNNVEINPNPDPQTIAYQRPNCLNLEPQPILTPQPIATHVYRRRNRKAESLTSPFKQGEHSVSLGFIKKENLGVQNENQSTHMHKPFEQRRLSLPPEEEQRLDSGTQKTNLGTQKVYPSAHDQKIDPVPMMQFRVGDIVWAKSPARNDRAWPGVIIDPLVPASQEVQRPSSIVDCCCVMFFGLFVGRGGNREYCWLPSKDILCFFNNRACNDEQKDTSALGMAILEAKHTMRGQNKLYHGGEGNVKAADHKCGKNGDNNAKAANHIYGKNGDNNVKGADHMNGDCHYKPGNNAAACATLPTCITVVCFGVDGAYYPKLHEVICLCSSCHGNNTLLSLTRWEAHTGCRQKKWKVSVKLKGSMQPLVSWLQSMVDSGAANLAFQVYSQEQVIKARLQTPYQPVMLKWTPEKCAVCGWVEDYDDNQMLVCNRCQIAVHEECYGVRVAETGNSFVCRACEDSSKTRECCLCPLKGGAFKPTVIPDLWVHVYCAWFTKGVFFQSITKMEPVDGILTIDLSRFKERCVVCKQVHGACIRCEECETTFHATCALRAGYRMELSSKSGQSELRKVSYCAQHRNPTENGRLVIAAVEAELLRQAKLKEEEIDSSAASNCDDTDVTTPSSSSPDDSDIDTPGNDNEEIRQSCSRAYVYQKSFPLKGSIREAVPNMPSGFSHNPRERILSLRKPLDTPEIHSIEDRLVYLEQTQKLRICFGKSAIHKWGLFTRQDIQEGDMVVEYKGEIVRRSVADIRERRYKQQGKDCYLFKVSEDVVIDATCKGNIARLINHSCAPNCFARIFPVKRAGGACIILIAKRNVMAREELTYDYLFESENRTVPCLCGAQKCRKFIC